MNDNKEILSAVERGKQYEDEACEYLQNQGLKLTEKNFSYKTGEIDLIMKDRNTLVFIEVRYRGNNQCGSGLESVNFSKRKKICKTAKYYLQNKKLTDKIPCRFDVVEVPANSNAKFLWIKDAFWLKY